MPRVKFTAVGPHAGKTITLDRFDFIDGEYTFEGTIDDARIIEKTLAEQYSAFRDDVLADARKRYDDAQAEAALEGPVSTAATREVSLKERKIAQRFIDENMDPVIIYGEGDAARMVQETIDQLLADSHDGDNIVTNEEFEAAEKLKAEQQSQDNSGDMPQPEDVKIETVVDALQALDTANDDHWTARGAPSVEAMIKLLGKSVTRAEIEEAIPNYTRSVAKTMKVRITT